MKKQIAAVLILLLTVSTLVMAGGGSEASADGKTTIRFFHRWTAEPKKTYYDNLVKEFEAANPDVKVLMDSVLNDSYKEKIRVLISRPADIPEVFCSWSDSFAYNLVKSGNIRVLNDMLAADPAFKDSFIQSQIAPFTFDGKTYGLPQTIDGKAIFYNIDIFDKVGIKKIPTQYKELIADMDLLKKAGYATPILEGLQDAWAISHYQGTIFQRIVPAKVLEADMVEKTGAFTDPGYKRGLEVFQQLATYMGPDANSMDHSAAAAEFIAGKIPMVYLQLSEVGSIQRDNPSLNYGMFNFPAIEGGAGDPSYMTGAPEGFMMSAHIEDPKKLDAATRLYKWIYSKDQIQKFVKASGSPVGVIGAYTSDNSFPKLVEAVDLISKLKAYPWYDNAVNIKIADAFMRGSQAVAVGDMTIDQVMKNVQDQAAIVRSEAK